MHPNVTLPSFEEVDIEAAQAEAICETAFSYGVLVRPGDDVLTALFQIQQVLIICESRHIKEFTLSELDCIRKLTSLGHRCAVSMGLEQFNRQSVCELLEILSCPAVQYFVLDSPVRIGKRSLSLEQWVDVSELWISFGVKLGVRHVGHRMLTRLSETGYSPRFCLLEHHPLLTENEDIEAALASGALVGSMNPLLCADSTNATLQPIRETFEQFVHDQDVSLEALLCDWCRRQGTIPIVAADQFRVVFPSTTPAANPIVGVDSMMRHWNSPEVLASRFSLPRMDTIARDPISTRDGKFTSLYPRLARNEADSLKWSERVWRFGFNLPSQLCASIGRQGDKVTQRILAELDEDGYAKTNVSELGIDDIFQELQSESSQLSPTFESGKKTWDYLHDSNAARSMFENETVRSIANQYFGMPTARIGGEVWVIPQSRTFEPRSGAQLWHVDIEDFMVLKLFVFLSDVNELQGPTEFLAKCHPKGRFAADTGRILRSVGRDREPGYSDDTVFTHFDPTMRRVATGPAGTVYFLDTRTIHRGGACIGGERRVAVVGFMSSSSAYGFQPIRASRGKWRLWNRLMKPFRWKQSSV